MTGYCVSEGENEAPFNLKISLRWSTLLLFELSTRFLYLSLWRDITNKTNTSKWGEILQSTLWCGKGWHINSRWNTYITTVCERISTEASVPIDCSPELNLFNAGRGVSNKDKSNSARRLNSITCQQGKSGSSPNIPFLGALESLSFPRRADIDITQPAEVISGWQATSVCLSPNKKPQNPHCTFFFGRTQPECICNVKAKSWFFTDGSP